jgi:adenylate kinase
LTSSVNGPVVIVHGKPGSGKQTQAERLAVRYSAIHISSGDLLRKRGNSGSTAEMATGGIAETPDLLTLLEDAIRAVPLRQPIILDGVTRREGEPEWLLTLLAELRRPFLGIIVLVVDDEVCLARNLGRAATSGRADDNPAVQADRLRNWHGITAVNLRVYTELGCQTIEVDGDQLPKLVELAVEAAMIALQQTVLRRAEDN